MVRLKLLLAGVNALVGEVLCGLKLKTGTRNGGTKEEEEDISTITIIN